MDITSIFGSIISYCGISGIVLCLGIIILFFVQLCYWAGRYRYLPRRRARVRDSQAAAGPISLVTVVSETDYSYLEQTLPRILGQEYDVFEVVLVDLTDDVDFSEALKLVAMNEPRINLTRLTVKPLFPISNKMALNVAIKAARYENILISTTNILPPGPRWFSHMAEGFSGADIVLGYNTMEEKRGRSNMMVRLSNTAATMRWINSAMQGNPYRGTIQNLGLKRKLYFDHNGFNHLNLNIGEEDLFIQYAAKHASAWAVADREASVCERVYGGAGWWNRRRLLYSNAFRYYTPRAKRYIGWELWSRALFFAAVVAAIILLPFEVKVAAGALLLVRYIVVAVQILRSARALGEKRLWPVIPVYDLFSPAYEFILCFIRRFKKTPGLWR